MKFINKGELTENFTSLPNEIANNPNISFKAKGILWYLLSKPEDWKTYIKEIAKNGQEGIDAVRSGVDELISLGYIVRTQHREKGIIRDWVYYVYATPTNADNTTLSPELGFPDMAKPDMVNPTILNTNNTKIDNTNTSYKKSSIETLSSNQLHKHLAEKFGVDVKYVANECEVMEDWLKSKGKKQKDYEAFARNWIRRNTKEQVVEKKRPTL